MRNETLIKDGARVEAIREKRTWNDKSVLVKVGQQGIAEVCGKSDEIRVYFDGQAKGTWMRVIDLKVIG